MPREAPVGDPTVGADTPAPRLAWPPDGAAVSTPNPNFRLVVDAAPGEELDFYFEVDCLPSFDSDYLQRSSDLPLLYRVLWRDVRFSGDRVDDDGDGLIDEEWENNRDDDDDGLEDEDIGHPLDGRKWPIVLFGTGFGLTAYFVLSFFGLPIFLIWGYVQSVTGVQYALLPQIGGALLARFYFWKRFGKQEWRRYAMVLSVGFAVGMSLVGMFCAALAMISKAASSLAY